MATEHPKALRAGNEIKSPENTFIIPVIFNHIGVRRCIQTIHRYNDNYRIILIDQTKEAKCAHLRHYVHLYIHSYRNLGFAKAMNTGAKIADTPYITLCNDDIEFVNKRWFPDIVDLFKRAPNLMAINPASIKEIGQDRIKDWMPYKETYTEEDYNYLLTPKKGFHPSWIFEGTMMFCTVFRKEAFDIVGYLCEGFYPGCFVPKSKVLMGNLTYKNIEDITTKDKVISRDGKDNKVNAVNKRYYKGDILEIQLVGTNEKIRLTPDHKLFIVDKTGPKGKRSVCWSRKEKTIVEKEAKDIQEKDLLYFPKLQLKDRKFYLIDYESFLRKVKSYNIESDEELFKIFGYFLAEGNYIKKSGYYSGLTFSFHIKEIEYINEIKTFCDRYEIPYSIYVRPKKTITTIEVYSAYLARIFLKLFGEYSYGKFIHPDIMQCSNELLKSLFMGYFNGDGCIHKGFKKGRSKDIYRQLEIKTVSRKLAESVHILLLKLYIPHLIYYNQKSKEKRDGWKRKPTYDIYISQTYFAELFNTKSNPKRKRNEVFKEDDKIFYPIKKIRNIKYKGFVYDLKVRNNHSYIVNQIAVHNSGEDYDWCRRCYEHGYKLVHWNGSFVYHHWLTSKNKFDWNSEDLKKYRVWPGFREKWMTDEEQDPDIYGKKGKGTIRPTLTIHL